MFANHEFAKGLRTTAVDIVILDIRISDTASKRVVLARGQMV